MNSSRWKLLPVALVAAVASPRQAVGDDLLHGYEGDVLPYHPSAGWVRGGPCEFPCMESVRDGHLVLEWPFLGSGSASYIHNLHRDESVRPAPPFWTEWGFRSNHPIGRHFYSCDGRFSIGYMHTDEGMNLYGDFAVNYSGDFSVRYSFDEIHTFRFESVDGRAYRMAVDGHVVIETIGTQVQVLGDLFFSGQGGCASDQIPNARNEWDFVRYGTIAFGERIVAAEVRMANGESRMANGEPGALRGFLNPVSHAGADRFTVTYSSPNYVYVDEITVEVSDAATGDEATKRQPHRGTIDAPQVIATRRLDNGPPDVVEIVLDRPLPPFARITFTFDDGVAVSTVEYVTADGDADSDNDRDLADFAAFQNCFGTILANGDGQPDPCGTGFQPVDCGTATQTVNACIFDLTLDRAIDAADFAELASIFTGP